MADKIISLSLPHQLKCIYLHHWIRNWLKTKKLIHTLEVQNGPHQISVHHSSQRCISLGHCVHSVISHDIKPSHSIAKIIQLTFQMRNPALSYLWAWSGAWWFRGSGGILWLSLTLRAAGHLLHCWRTETPKLDSERQTFGMPWNWVFVHRHPSTGLRTWPLLKIKLRL